MSMKSRLIQGLVVAGVAASAVFMAAPAQAATSNCPSGAACIWGDSGYVTANQGAAYVAFQKYIPNYSLWTYNTTTYGANDSASSVYNNGNLSTVTFYRDANKGGWSVSWAKKTGDSNLSTNGVNDEISSGYFAGF
ncbi:MAG: peptidase inhibitor family I36 protein [Cellulomonas sp.]|nr:peptidase inhibitor family I36 protein [Cellulomonas sp.]